jgi:hypothetical protein
MRGEEPQEKNILKGSYKFQEYTLTCVYTLQFKELRSNADIYC